MRDGVGKSEGNVINRAFLLPVRQPIRSETYVYVRIEETQFFHETPSAQSQHGLGNFKNVWLPSR